MWHTLVEGQNQHLTNTCKIWGEDQPVMDVEISDQQAKQERLRTRWTTALDKIFADIVVQQILQGNRPNNVFDKKTWNQIREEFNKQTNLNFNNNQLRKHLDVLRTRYHSLQSALNQNDAIQDPCYMGFDLWEDIGAQSKIEPAKTKECPIYDQLCTIFADGNVDGKYAQSSHYGELYKSAASIDPLSADIATPLPETPSSSKFPEGNGSSPQATDKKRKRPLEAGSTQDQSSNWNQELSHSMAEAISDVINSSELRNLTKSMDDERYSISSCIKAMDNIQGIDDGLYYASLDLFENSCFREVFMSLNGNHVRLAWLLDLDQRMDEQHWSGENQTYSRKENRDRNTYEQFKSRHIFENSNFRKSFYTNRWSERDGINASHMNRALAFAIPLLGLPSPFSFGPLWALTH